ncbi:MAG: NAD(P)/FAD-dependent oxidoreductase [Methanomicrobia archaeon]|nr:NAD(P)/FAD-dependent oxidoreductase [Methanomicrobia archaeon]
MDVKYDVIIIGAGIGGLSAGIYLQCKNPELKTIILEQHSIPGGYVSGFKRKGFYFDAGAEGIMGMEESGSIRKSLMDLGFDHEFIRIDPLDVYYHDDKIFALYNSYEKLIEEVEKNYPDQKEGFQSFLEACKTIVKKTKEGKKLPEYTEMSMIKFLDKYGLNDSIKDCFNLFCFWYGATPDELSAYYLAHIIDGVVQGGVFYPKEGMQAFSDKMADFYAAHGGTISYNTKVQKIIVEEGKVKGVILDNGTILNANWVISNADLKRTVFDCVGKEHFSKDYWEAIQRLKQSTTGIILFLGVDMDLSKYPSHFQIGQGLDVVERVRNNEFQLNKLAVRIPANIDPSLKNKEGYSIVAFIFAPYNWKNYWQAGPNKERTSEYKQYKEEIANKMIALIETVIPGLSKHVVVKELGTPLTFERYTLTTEGAWFGPFTFQKLPNFKTPIGNLFLAGSNVSGSGVPPAIRSGLNTAKYVLEKMDR